MLSVFDTVGKQLKLKLITEEDAPYHSGGLKRVTQKSNEAIPANYPCLYVRGLDEGTAGTNFENEQCYINSVIELQSFVASADEGGTQTQAQKIMSNAGDVLLSMGYQLMGGFPYQNDTESYYSTIARFQRLVGSGDEICRQS